MNATALKRLALGALLAVTVTPSLHADPAAGPTRPPREVAAWPGRGVGYTYDLWFQRRDEFWQNRAKDQGAVVFFGDSITHRWDVAKTFPELKTANRGIGGDTSRGLLVRLQEDVLDLNPRAVVLLVGFNDLNSNGKPADTVHNIRLMLDAMRRHRADMPVIVCKMMPSKSVPGKFPDTILAVNRLLDGLAVGRPNVTVCDTWTPYATPEGTARPEEFPDTVHPNAAGYAKWAAELQPIFARLGLAR